MIIVYKNIDEITAREEVYKTLEKQFDLIGLQDSAVKIIKKNLR